MSEMLSPLESTLKELNFAAKAVKDTLSDLQVSGAEIKVNFSSAGNSFEVEGTGKFNTPQ